MSDDDILRAYIRELSDLDVQEGLAAVDATPAERALEVLSGVLWRSAHYLIDRAVDVDDLRRCMQRRRAARQLGARQ